MVHNQTGLENVKIYESVHLDVKIFLNFTAAL